MPENNLLDSSCAYLTDTAGDGVTVTEATTGPLVTRKAPRTTPGSALTSHARHVLQSSTGNAVFARPLDADIFARGAADALTSPRHPLLTRRDSLVVATSRILLPGICGQTTYGYSY